jgi:DNA mismatch repair ATPase MutS
LTVASEPSSEIIRHLGELAGLLDQRLNILVGLFLNGMILWDIKYLLRLEKWKRQYAEYLLPWLDMMGEWDALQSLGRYAFNYPEHVYPQVKEGEFHLIAKELGHPLLKPGVRVCNDMALHKTGEFLIITGANMAGKSTFLRTVGSNLILASCGAPVCAQSYSFVPIPLITSIRAHDSLEDNESYFYAELKQLKKVIDQLDQGPAFVIVDEMLRGTNSRDKQTGSRKFIEQLIRKKGVGMIATHDLALGTLADDYPDYAFNKRFEVDITDDQLTFDYKLRDGISQNLNATFLMEQMGIM